MHATQLDLAPVLAELKLIPNPPTANVFAPTPNHSRVIPADTVTIKPKWWQVRPILVLQSSDWPSRNAKTGITSTAKMNAAVKAGRAMEVPSNFFLYFGSKVEGMNMAMGH